MTMLLQSPTDMPGVSVGGTSTGIKKASHKRSTKKAATAPIINGDQYGRTGRTQVLHVDLWYGDGTKGEINVTAPQIINGEDIEKQWNALRGYLKQEYKALGIIRYHAHCATIKDGVVRITWSWFPFDLIQNKEVR